ncbi:MAG: hypothetical protein GWP06_02880 [Actinobacteria bacterium]|nr:hypothetical protein [Actinomycetota bacterium]
MTISHIDLVKKQVLGPAIPGWQFWELPVEPVEHEKPDYHESIVSVADIERFIESIDLISKAVHWNAVEKGFWDQKTAEDYICEQDDCAGLKITAEDLKSAYIDGQKNPEPNNGEKIALMHSELSEMLEGVRKPGPDKHCPEFTNEEIELADNFIRGMDYAEKFNLRLSEAIIAKMLYNSGRPYKHDKEF